MPPSFYLWAATHPSIPEQGCGAGPPPGAGALTPDVGVQSVLQCATRDYRYRAGAEDSQTPVRNSDPMAVESRGDRASRHGRIVRISTAHSWSYRSDNPICTRTPARPLRSWRSRRFVGSMPDPPHSIEQSVDCRPISWPGADMVQTNDPLRVDDHVTSQLADIATRHPETPAP